MWEICKHFVENIFKQAQALLHTVELFQVLLYNSHNLTSVIYLSSLFYLIRLSGGATPGQSGPGSNEGVLHILQIKAGASPSDN